MPSELDSWSEVLSPFDSQSACLPLLLQFRQLIHLLLLTQRVSCCPFTQLDSDLAC